MSIWQEVAVKLWVEIALSVICREEKVYTRRQDDYSITTSNAFFNTKTIHRIFLGNMSLNEIADSDTQDFPW